MDKRVFTLILSSQIPEDHIDLKVNDKYSYQFQGILKDSLFLYKLHETDSLAPAFKLYRKDFPEILTHHDYLKLKYG